jgi:hypothetical protein
VTDVGHVVYVEDRGGDVEALAGRHSFYSNLGLETFSTTSINAKCELFTSPSTSDKVR